MSKLNQGKWVWVKIGLYPRGDWKCSIGSGLYCCEWSALFGIEWLKYILGACMNIGQLFVCECEELM